MIELSIIIVNYNTANHTVACLQSIVNQSMSVSYELIVVDNASTDLSAVLIKSQIPKVIWIQNSTNLGFGSAVNIGVAFKEILSYNRILAKLFNRWFKSIPDDVKALHGACLLIERSLFQSLNGFDTDFFLYSEEFDLSRRILKKGYILRCYDEVSLFHGNEVSSPNKSWNLRQRSASIALLFRKTHGVFGLLFYYWLIVFNLLSNGVLWWRMNLEERKDLRFSALIHLANLDDYFRILFRLNSNVPIKVK